MSLIKNWKAVGEKNAALEHCWGLIAAKNDENERLQCELRLAISARDYANDMLDKGRANELRVAEAIRAKCEAIIRDHTIMDTTRGKQFRPRREGDENGLFYADAIAALKGNLEPV